MRLASPLDLLDRFMKGCKVKGWEAGEYRDFIKAHDDYSLFMLFKKVYPKLEEVLWSEACSIFEKGHYKVTNIKYRALIFQEHPPNWLVRTVSSDPELSKRIAVYDFTELNEEKPTCGTINLTTSVVFAEFDEFLTKRMKISLVPIGKKEASTT